MSTNRPLAWIAPLLLLLGAWLGGCGEEPSPAHQALAALRHEGELFPLAEGTRWTWRARLGNRAWEVRAHKLGGDVRARDGRDVHYEFLYADLDDELVDVMKSIYANPPEGPQEFHFDAFRFRMQHDPPVPILPVTFELGARWTWTGRLTIDGDKSDVTTTLLVQPVEQITTPAGTYTALRVDETAPGVSIVRWFAPGVGLVQMEVVAVAADATTKAFRLELLAFEPAP
ncbi:MAG: hypothetical protein P1V36_08800 [Planctomycetota bacterium]|nr:hypothetical protein [Planctomycetota bacterium]